MISASKGITELPSSTGTVTRMKSERVRTLSTTQYSDLQFNNKGNVCVCVCVLVYYVYACACILYVCVYLCICMCVCVVLNNHI